MLATPAYVAHFVFLGDVWIRTQRAAVASRAATNLAAHPPVCNRIFVTLENLEFPRLGWLQIRIIK